jgi:hypothetical protein
MRRAILMAVATMSLLGADAMADNFTFSFTGTTGTGATGTVTGEIFGLRHSNLRANLPRKRSHKGTLSGRCRTYRL